MKNDWLITFRSVTFAQRGERLMKQEGIFCTLQRTPRELSERGCGYCLRLRGRDAMAAVSLLQRGSLSFGKVYRLSDDGKPEERTL